jgi:hypothetical protein
MIILLMLVIFGGYAAWDLGSKQDLQRSVLARWSSNRTVHHRPVITEHFGSDPRTSYVGAYATVGVIGVADDRVIFVRRGGQNEMFIPLDRLCWIGTYPITLKQGKTTVNRPALVLHHEDGDRWYVSVFVIRDQSLITSLLNTLEQQTGLIAMHGRMDFGPHSAQRMSQDIYGQWQTAASDGVAWSLAAQPSVMDFGGLSGQLYLSPDRLIYNGKPIIHLVQIRQVELYEQGGLHKLNPFNEELLRIEYDQDDQHHVTGFLVRSGRKWAEALALRLNIPVEVHEGRKKKEG